MVSLCRTIELWRAKFVNERLPGLAWLCPAARRPATCSAISANQRPIFHRIAELDAIFSAERRRERYLNVVASFLSAQNADLADHEDARSRRPIGFLPADLPHLSAANVDLGSATRDELSAAHRIRPKPLMPAPGNPPIPGISRSEVCPPMKATSPAALNTIYQQRKNLRPWNRAPRSAPPRVEPQAVQQANTIRDSPSRERSEC